MYKFDTHVHTAESSICSKVMAKDMVNLYLDAGFSGVCITDHYCKGGYTGFDRWDGSWPEKVNRFLEGYRIAAEYGSSLGLTVLPGAELRFSGFPSDFLLFGLTEQFLYDYPELYDYVLEDFRALAKQHDILVFQAHPFRGEKGNAADPRYLDGVEVLNGHNGHNSRNDLAAEFAKENSLLACAGSDFHHLGGHGTTGLLTSTRIQSMDTLRKVLGEQNFSIIQPLAGAGCVSDTSPKGAPL